MLTSAMAMMIGLQGNDPATYIGGGQRAGSGNPAALTLPVGVEPGDQIVVVLGSGDVMSGGAGGTWSYSAAFGSARTATKRLEAGDISGVLSVNGYPMVYGVYRGPKSTARRTTGSAAGAGPVLSGFTKDPFCAGLVGAGYGNGLTTAPPTFPAPFTARQTVHPGGGIAGLTLWDLLTPASYVDGASINMGASSNGTTYGAVDELLN